MFAAELPDKVLSISYEVLPKWKEYERASTTIADAYLKPIVGRQLAAMRERLDAADIMAPAVIIKSNGGEMSIAAAGGAPVNMVLSGPTGGVIAELRRVAQDLGIDHLVTIERLARRAPTDVPSSQAGAACRWLTATGSSRRCRKAG